MWHCTLMCTNEKWKFYRVFMARQARVYSKLNTYTIVLRGRTDIFSSPTRKQFFIDSVMKNKEGVSVYAYAITDKDAYLVLNVHDGNISKVVKSISVSFARKYNLRYRIGKVFYDRYLSQAHESTQEILDAIKNVNLLIYTGNEKTKDSWVSSYDEYFNDALIDATFVKENLNESFEEFHKTKHGAQFVQAKKLSDEEIAEYIYKKYNVKASDVVTLNRDIVSTIVLEIMQVTKVSARQIARITTLPLRFLWSLGKSSKKTKEVAK